VVFCVSIQERHRAPVNAMFIESTLIPPPTIGPRTQPRATKRRTRKYRGQVQTGKQFRMARGATLRVRLNDSGATLSPADTGKSTRVTIGVGRARNS
jgi:hypothetical protein